MQFLCYKSLTKPLRTATHDDLLRCGLLTASEVDVLHPMQNKQRDMAIAWVGGEVNAMLDQGHISDSCRSTVFDAIAGIRGTTARFHDMFARNNPNGWTSVMVLVTDLLMLLVMMGFPLSLLACKDLDISRFIRNPHP